ncbi:MAG: hypothetical protein EBV02_00630 [Actinobacteria bacterium]|nr:hypothetical protein [Actinomycetota bacterium]
MVVGLGTATIDQRCAVPVVTHEAAGLVTSREAVRATVAAGLVTNRRGGECPRPAQLGVGRVVGLEKVEPQQERRLLTV